MDKSKFEDLLLNPAELRVLRSAARQINSTDGGIKITPSQFATAQSLSDQGLVIFLHREGVDYGVVIVTADGADYLYYLHAGKIAAMKAFIKAILASVIAAIILWILKTILSGL